MIMDILFLLGLFVGMFFLILVIEAYHINISYELANLPNRISYASKKINLVINQLKRYIKKNNEKAS